MVVSSGPNWPNSSGPDVKVGLGDQIGMATYILPSSSRKWDG